MSDEEVELTPAQKKGVEIFKKLLEEHGDDSDIVNFESRTIHRAHEMWRNKEMSSEEFAVVIDEIICY